MAQNIFYNTFSKTLHFYLKVAMTQFRRGNFAYIDGQNLHLGMRDLGWKLDMARFRTYLAEKYHVGVAKFFIGYIPENEGLYNSLRRKGYQLIFKPTIKNNQGEYKGNVDAEMILETTIDYYEKKCDQVVIVTSDGDFYCLIKFLDEKNSLKSVLSSREHNCSSLVKQAAKTKLNYITNLRGKLEYKQKSTA